MTEYIQLIALTLVGGAVSLLGGLLLIRNKSSARNLAEYATPFAAGALLAAVFLDLLSDGIEEGGGETLLYAALGGILFFFIAERFLHWFHHHHQHEHDQHHGDEDASKPLIIVGDTMHNALDGVAIASAFLINPATGVVTALAVAAHEIPQEIGDFGLLLKKGMRRKNVIIVNILSALATTVFAVITYAVGSANALPTELLIGISAGFLLYIAMSDIIPDIHEQVPKHKLLDWRPIMLLVGVLVVGVAINLAHGYIDAGHGHAEESHHEVHGEKEHHSEHHEDHEEAHHDEADGVHHDENH